MQIAAQIEKNRRKLLRLTSFWIFSAIFARCGLEILPTEFKRWLSTLVSKMELATGFLIQAESSIFGKSINENCRFIRMAKAFSANSNSDFSAGDHASIDVLITRLKAVQAALRKMKSTTHFRAPKVRVRTSPIRRWLTPICAKRPFPTDTHVKAPFLPP